MLSSSLAYDNLFAFLPALSFPSLLPPPARLPILFLSAVFLVTFSLKMRKLRHRNKDYPSLGKQRDF